MVLWTPENVRKRSVGWVFWSLFPPWYLQNGQTYHHLRGFVLGGRYIRRGEPSHAWLDSVRHWRRYKIRTPLDMRDSVQQITGVLCYLTWRSLAGDLGLCATGVSLCHCHHCTAGTLPLPPQHKHYDICPLGGLLCYGAVLSCCSCVSNGILCGRNWGWTIPAAQQLPGWLLLHFLCAGPLDDSGLWALCWKGLPPTLLEHWASCCRHPL